MTETLQICNQANLFRVPGDIVAPIYGWSTQRFNKTDIKIRVYGKVAVLSGYIDVKIVGRDSYRVRTLEIYQENSGQWQLADKESVRAGGGRSSR